MSQISYSILEILRTKDSHIRGLAKLLGINQMSVARAVKRLAEENVLDFRKEGRNSVYFLKGSLEAKEYLYILEHKKLIEVMSLYPRLRVIVKKIKESPVITCALLFGSYAKKIPKESSDIDVYLETQNKRAKHELELLDSKLSIKVGKFEKNSILGTEIINCHVVIKGIERYHELICEEAIQGKKD